MTHKAAAITVAQKLTNYAKTSKIQLCNYGKRYTFAKGTEFVPDGHCIRAAHMKDGFIVGTFKAYEA
jgi:hypothetical protein